MRSSFMVVVTLNMTDVAVSSPHATGAKVGYGSTLTLDPSPIQRALLNGGPEWVTQERLPAGLRAGLCEHL